MTENAESFYLLPAEGGGVPVRVEMQRLKALFWVKDYVGNSDFVGRRELPDRPDTRVTAIADRSFVVVAQEWDVVSVGRVAEFQ